MIATALVLVSAIVAGANGAVLEKRTTACANGLGSVSNAACCNWLAVRNDLLENVFENICGENAHSTIRIAFHDAIGFSTKGGKGGGADGSIIAFQNIELQDANNNGISDIVTDLQPLADAHGISYGDVIQFGSSVALTLCPGAPRVQTFVGRKNASAAAPGPVSGHASSLPAPFDTVASITTRFADAGFSPQEFVALLASHTVAAQDKVDESIHGSPFDSTPGEFDSQVFLETLLRGTAFPGGDGANQGEVESPLPGEFRLQSDSNIARDSSTACFWQQLALSQAAMASQFSKAMTKLSLLGQSKSALTDCTEVLGTPAPATHAKAYFPAGTNHGDIEQACATAAFPTTLSTQSGSLATVAPVPTQ